MIAKEAGGGPLVRVFATMGTMVSVHGILNPHATADHAHAAERFTAAVNACEQQLTEIDRLFSPYRDDSEISRLHDGTLALRDADPRIHEVRIACEHAEQLTEGRFSAFWNGWFDPTGYVKGWAVEAAFHAHLAPLLHEAGFWAVGVNAGGDMQLATAAGADWDWQIGIADPHHPGAVCATVSLRNGAVATSGTAERGDHIVDPRRSRSGTSAHAAASATVVAAQLSDADVWATAAIVSGADDLSWISRASHTNGILIDAAGGVRRWAAGVELGVASATDARLVLPLAR